MPHVITQLCHDCQDTTCVAVCPVACIYVRRPDAPADPMWRQQAFIHPSECIDCGNCPPVCPWQAIYEADELPAVFADAVELNAKIADRPDEFEVLPVVRNDWSPTPDELQANFARQGLTDAARQTLAHPDGGRFKRAYAVLDAHGRLVSLHDAASAAVTAAHDGGATRVFDAAGCLLSGPAVPEEPPLAPPTLPPLAKSWSRNPDLRKLMQLLALEDDEAFDERLDEAIALAGRLADAGRPLRVKIWAELDDFGGYSAWGWRVTTVRSGRSVVGAWCEHFTAEAPHGHGWCVYEGECFGSTPIDSERLETVGAEIDTSGFPDDLDEAVALYGRQWRRRRKRAVA